MGKVLNAYIDEAGDEGFKVKDGKWLSSKWFITGALIVPEEVDRDMASTINEIKDILEPKNKFKPLHFCKLSHKRRKVVVQKIKDKKHFRLIIVGVYKPEIKNEALKKGKQVLYNYTTRYLLERISWLGDDHKREVNMVFENRSNTSYGYLDDYVQQLLKDPKCEIRKDVLRSWKTLNKSQSKNLQVADSLISSTFAALEPDAFGNVETSYIDNIIDFFYVRNGNLFSYGLKLFPHSGNSVFIKNKYEWVNEILMRFK